MSQGQNLWYDLMTNDVDGAIRFYTETIGWKAQPWEGADPSNPYTVFYVGETGVAGVMALPDDAKQSGVPPHWMSYTHVADVDATTTAVQSNGGTVYRSGWDIPEVGRIGVYGDPQGAVFSAFTPSTYEAPPSGDEPGTFSWTELNTTDHEAAWTFYSRLFGWQETEKMDMGDSGVYFMFQDPTGATKGGISNMAKFMNFPPSWIHYVTVRDIEATVGRINQNGGSVMMGPREIPGGDLIAHCVDPQGAAFAIFATKNT